MDRAREARDDDRRLKVQKRLVPLKQKVQIVSIVGTPLSFSII